MEKYIYPLVITEEETIWGKVSGQFPAFPEIIIHADSVYDVMMKAKDALGHIIDRHLTNNIPLPEDTLPNMAELAAKNQSMSLILCDYLLYQRVHNNRAVKKTLTIPMWLNEIAVAQNINFSQVLQEALKKELKIE